MRRSLGADSMDNLDRWNGNRSRPSRYCALTRFLRARGPAVAGIAGPILFWSVLIILGRVQPAYNAVTHDISLLAIGDEGWTQTTNFIVFGLSIIVFQRGLVEAIAPGRAWGSMSILAFASGLALVAMAIFPTDPPGTWTAHGAVHLGVVAVLALLLPIVCFMAAAKVKRLAPWRGYARFTILTGMLTGMMTLVLLLVWGGAWRALHPWLGLFERAVFAVPSVWMGVMGVRLMKNRGIELDTAARAEGDLLA